MRRNRQALDWFRWRSQLRPGRTAAPGHLRNLQGTAHADRRDSGQSAGIPDCPGRHNLRDRRNRPLHCDAGERPRRLSVRRDAGLGGGWNVSGDRTRSTADGISGRGNRGTQGCRTMSITPAGTNQPVAVAQIDVAELEMPDGSYSVTLKVRAANGMLEVGLLLNHEHAKAIANALATKAKQCAEKIVIPRSQIASA